MTTDGTGSRDIDRLLQRGPQGVPDNPQPGREYVVAYCKVEDLLCTLEVYETIDRERGYACSAYQKGEGSVGWRDLRASGAWDYPKVAEVAPTEFGWLGSRESLPLDNAHVMISVGFAGVDVTAFVIEAEDGRPLSEGVIERSGVLFVAAGVVPPAARIIPRCRSGAPATSMNGYLEF